MDQNFEENKNRHNISEFTSGGYGVQKQLPNSSAVLILGILSLLLCWAYGIISVILGIIALVMASGAEREIVRRPGEYSEVSCRNLRTGKFCAILGLAFGILSFFIMMIWIWLFGTMLFSFFG